MKYVILMRHAKSSWKEAGMKDFDRPLNKRGSEDAPGMAKFLEQTGNLPERIIASPAKRVVQTTNPLTDLSKNIDEPIWDEHLYYGSVDDYMEAIRRTPSDFESIMLIGHNPMIEELVNRFNYETKNMIKIPTAATAYFEFDIKNWEALHPESETGTFKWLMTPKNLKNRS